MTQDLTDIIKKGNEKWMTFYKSGNFQALANLYTPECQLFPPGAPKMIGRDACEKFWSGLHQSGAAKIVLKYVECIQGGSTSGVEQSEYYIYKADGTEIDHGKYVVVWKRLEDGQWYLHDDMFNSDVSQQPPSLSDEVHISSNKWLEAFNAHDFPALSQLYTEDCRLMAPHHPLVIGRKNCADLFEGLYKMGGNKMVFKNEKVEDLGGDLASDTSLFWLYDQDGQLMDTGKYVVILRKEGSSWLLHYDIFNSSNT